MKFIHTSDWHVGKTLKGIPRIDEQRAVLKEILQLTREHEVDAVLIAGDLYETSAPGAEAQQLVVETMLAMRQAGAEVLVIAGNHDHAATFDAYRPLMRAAGITLLGHPRPAERGGVVTFTARSTGEPVRVAMVPFVSQRYAITAAELVAHDPAANAASYDAQVRAIVRSLSESFSPDAVNLVMAHLTVIGGTFGGGERQAQSIFEYSVPASIFGHVPHYVALGHLHRRQQLAAACPVHYCGAPFAVDFGEQDNTNVICLVEAHPGTPAQVQDLPITSAVRLRTVRGTVADLAAMAADCKDDLLRVWVQEPTRAGLRQEVQAVLPNALEVRIDPDFADPEQLPDPSPAVSRSPAELFKDFMDRRNVSDPRVEKLFARLLDEATAAGGEGSR